MDKKLLDYNNITGLQTWYSIDSDGTEQIEYVGDAEPVLEFNKALQNNNEATKNGIKQGFWHYASIPAGLQMKWLVEEGIDVYNKDHMPRVLKKLQDPEFRYLKTTTKVHLKPDH